MGKGNIELLFMCLPCHLFISFSGCLLSSLELQNRTLEPQVAHQVERADQKKKVEEQEAMVGQD